MTRSVVTTLCPALATARNALAAVACPESRASNEAMNPELSAKTMRPRRRRYDRWRRSRNHPQREVEGRGSRRNLEEGRLAKLRPLRGFVGASTQSALLARLPQETST